MNCGTSGRSASSGGAVPEISQATSCYLGRAPELAAACFGLQKSKGEKLLRLSASLDGIKGCGTLSHRASENRKGNPKFARTGIETEQLQALASDGMQMVVNGHSGESAD